MPLSLHLPLSLPVSFSASLTFSLSSSRFSSLPLSLCLLSFVLQIEWTTYLSLPVSVSVCLSSFVRSPEPQSKRETVARQHSKGKLTEHIDQSLSRSIRPSGSRILSMRLSLCISLQPCTSASLCVYFYLSVSISASASLCRYLCLSLCLSLSLFLPLSRCLLSFALQNQRMSMRNLGLGFL